MSIKGKHYFQGHCVYFTSLAHNVKFRSCKIFFQEPELIFQMDSGSPVVCLHNSIDMCSSYYVSGFFSFRNKNDGCHGNHNILSNVLDQSGNNNVASFIMENENVSLAFEQEAYLGHQCKM